MDLVDRCKRGPVLIPYAVLTDEFLSLWILTAFPKYELFSDMSYLILHVTDETRKNAVALRNPVKSVNLLAKQSSVIK